MQKWVNLVASTLPLVTDFQTTGGYGTPLCISDQTALAYYLGRGDKVNQLYSEITAEPFGADPTGTVDSTAAIQAAIDFLALIAKNPSSGNFYKTSRDLVLSDGKYLLSNYLEVKHNLRIRARGISGRHSTSGGAGAALLQWNDTSDGFRFQFPTTSGQTTVDGFTHEGVAFATLEGLTLDGGHTTISAATDNSHHALVYRSCVDTFDCDIRNWGGKGIQGWAGNVLGFGFVSGNLSAMSVKRCRFMNCLIGAEFRGGDVNLLSIEECEFYQNRQAGYIGDNGAGGTSVKNCHCASNGMISNTGSYTRCSNAGNWYALTWTGNPLNPPSGTTADTADWRYVSAGGVIANLIPAWIAVAGLFRPGGDYNTWNNSGEFIDQSYQEGGGFSHFDSPQTLVIGGTLAANEYRGGMRLIPTSTGMSYEQTGNTAWRWRTGGNEVDQFYEDLSGNIFAYSAVIPSGRIDLVGSGLGYVWRVGTPSVYTAPGALDANGWHTLTGLGYYVGSNRVLTDRQAGTPAAATDLATVITLANFLRTALQTHGAIA